MRYQKSIGITYLSIAVGFMILLVSPARAWQPSVFEIFCGKPRGTESDLSEYNPLLTLESLASGPTIAPGTSQFYESHYGDDVDIAGAPNCLSTERVALVQDYAAIALNFYRSLGFDSPSPNRLGPVVEGADGAPRVRLYVVEDQVSIANTRSPCSGSGGPVDPDWVALMRFAPRYINDLPPPRAHHIIAHEVFHVVQTAQQIVNNPQTNDCASISDWLYEGMADAMGVYVTHRRFPSYYPDLAVAGALSFYGLRPYNRAFAWHDDTTRDGQGNLLLPHYRTSSFWQYLADQYYAGSFAYTTGYLAVPNLSPGVDDWLEWLDAVLRSKDPGVGHPLYLVFPDFLANFATWGRDRFPNIGQAAWLDRAFGGCETISLSPEHPTQDLALDMEMISGQCLEVIVSGLAPGDLAQVKFMAFGQTETEVDNLHLAVADLGAPYIDTPQMETSCYRQERTAPGRPSCIVKPYTGERPDQPGMWMRTWSPARQIAASERLENLYILAHTPVAPHDSLHNADVDAQQVRLTVGLDISRLTTAEAGPARLATAAANMASTDNIPMNGNTPAGSAMGGFGTNFVMQAIGAELGNLPQFAFSMNTPNIGAGQAAGLSMVSFAGNDISTDGALSPTHQLVLQPTDGPIPFNATGRYSAFVTVTNEAAVNELNNLQSPTSVFQAEAFGREIARLVDAGLMAGGGPSGQAEIEVIAFSDDLLHLRASGYYCHLSDTDGPGSSCRNPQEFSAELITPFGWAWDPARRFVSVDTPGMALYRQELSNVMTLQWPILSNPAPAPATQPEPASQPSEAYQCSCSCEELSRFVNLGPLMTTPETSAQAMKDLMAMQMCPQQCQAGWSAC